MNQDKSGEKQGGRRRLPMNREKRQAVEKTASVFAARQRDVLFCATRIPGVMNEKEGVF